MDAWPDLHLECLPNRDSLQYEETYGIDGIKTMFRGTLRYRGFSSLLHAFKMLGMFENLAPPLDGLEDTWDDLLENLRMSRGGFESMDDFLLVCAEDDPDEAIRFRKCLEWLGMSGNSPVYRKSQQHHSSLKDLFCHVLQEKLQYKKHDNERDMVLMHHTIRAKFEDGTTEEHHSSLQAFGDRTMSAMCKTVGYTAAASTELILNGSFKGKHGLLLPTKREIYQPVLERVRKEGIVFEETVKFEQPDLENARLRAH